MILAFDTYYYDNKAKTVAIAFENWTDPKPTHIFSEILENIADYEPGAFYKRELPCIISLLQVINNDETMDQSIEAIIVDGFVYLDDDQKLGLGGYLAAYLSHKIPIIGVAKSDFRGIERLKQSLLRGESLNPLFITSFGIDLSTATSLIKKMEGQYRMPTLLKLLDTTTKE